MINYLVTYVLKKYFNLHYDLTVRDPYNEYIPVNNDKTKFKKVAHKLPDNLSKNDEMILHPFRKKAFRYDMWFQIIGIPFGLSNLIQLVPVVGVVITSFQSIRLMLLAFKLTNGFPVDLTIYFVFNIAVDLALGLIPIVGDLISIGYKANLRNYGLLLDHLQRISDYNNGLITKSQVRPNMLNNRINWFKETPRIELDQLPDSSKKPPVSGISSGINITPNSININPKGAASSKSHMPATTSTSSRTSSVDLKSLDGLN